MCVCMREKERLYLANKLGNGDATREVRKCQSKRLLPLVTPMVLPERFSPEGRIR